MPAQGTLKLTGATFAVTEVLLASGSVVDLNGEADALILDAAQNVRLDGSAAGHLKVKISGYYDFDITANTFTALSGSTIATNTIAETTGASGVTIDGVLLKDGGAVFADAATIEIDTINEATSAAGVTLDGVLLKDSQVTTDVILEKTGAAGVTIDGVKLKDTAAYGRTPVLALSVNGAVTVPVYNTVFFLTKAGVLADTIVDPTATTHDGVELTFVATTANAHTLSNAAGTGFNAGGAASDVATFGGAVGDYLKIVAYQAVWYVLSKTNVTLA